MKCDRLIATSLLGLLLACGRKETPGAAATPPSVAQPAEQALRPPAAPLHDTYSDLRAKVQGFFDWYAHDSLQGPNIDSVVVGRPQLLADELRRLLTADQRCVSESHEICRIEFDPFVNSQDPCGRYEVREASARVDTVSFAVYPRCTWMPDSTPALTAIVLPHGSSFQFVNFLYGKGSDLLTILRSPDPR